MSKSKRSSITHLGAPTLCIHQHVNFRIYLEISDKIPAGINPTFHHRSSLFDEFDATGGGGHIVQYQQGWMIDIPLVGTRDPGLYILTKLVVTFVDGTEEAINADLPLEVIPAGSILLTDRQVEINHNQILAARHARAAQGLGSGTDAFQFIYFLVDCKITQPLDLYDFVLKPFGNLGNIDLARSMSGYLSERNVQIAESDLEQMLLSHHHAPITLLVFPKILANSESEAIDFADIEAKQINDIISIHRHGYGEIIGTIAIKPSGEILFRGKPKTYRGNLIGGGVSGEYRTGLFAVTDRVRSNQKSQFYLSLYTSAFQEEKIEFRYFRMWSLLETIAKNKAYVGRPRLNWNGVQITSSAGTLLMIEDQAEQLVFELIREVWAGQPFSHGLTLTQGSIEQLVPIWYRHRNCVGHGGGCFPNDPIFCDRVKAKYINCKQAHTEQTTKYGRRAVLADDYMTTLEQAVRHVVLAEL